MVVKLSSAVGVGLLWLAAVAGVSVTAWVAIDRAGSDMAGGLVNSRLPLGVGAVTVTSSPRTAATSTSTPKPPGELTSKVPTPTVGKSADGQQPPAAVHGSGSTTPQDRTISASGGQVSVRCAGKKIQLRIAQPQDGWRVKVENAGPDEVEVGFRPGDEERHGGTKVTAVCSGGTPVFRTESQS